MKTKLTPEQIYQHEYHQRHKNDKAYKERRSRNHKRYWAKPANKKKRNAKMRRRWATDAEYRKHISEYQKAWRKKQKAQGTNSACVKQKSRSSKNG